MDADNALTSNDGVIEPPLKPAAELLSGFLISAISSAEFGRPASRPKSTVAEPANEALTPTSYESTAPSLKKLPTVIPAPGIGAERSSLEYCKESGLSVDVTVASSSNEARKF